MNQLYQEVIFDHLFELSDGKINLKKKDEDLSEASDLIKNTPSKRHNKPNHKSNKKGNRNRGRKRY